MKKAATPTDSGRHARSLRILCADDDGSLATMMQLALGRFGHDVELARDGKQALERIENADGKTFDVVITDNEMPNVGGLALVSRLREDRFPGKIIVHCSELKPRDAAAYRKLCVDGMLQKPVALPELVRVVHEIGGVAR